MFDVKRPCKDCPFVKRSSTNKSLPPERIKEIANNVLNDGHFFCHKTIDYENRELDQKPFLPKKGEHICAGSVLYMQRAGATTRFLTIMQRMGLYSPDDYKGLELIIDPVNND